MFHSLVISPPLPSASHYLALSFSHSQTLNEYMSGLYLSVSPLSLPLSPSLSLALSRSLWAGLGWAGPGRGPVWAVLGGWLVSPVGWLVGWLVG